MTMFFCDNCDDHVRIVTDLNKSDGMLNCEHCDLPMYWHSVHPDPGYGGTIMWAHMGKYILDGDSNHARLWRYDTKRNRWRTIGSTHVDRSNNHIVAMIDAPYNPDTDSDVTVVFNERREHFGTDLDAIVALWNSRENAA